MLKSHTHTVAGLKCQGLAGSRDLSAKGTIERMEMRLIVRCRVFPLFVGPSVAWPFLVSCEGFSYCCAFSVFQLLISPLTPITDTMSLCDLIGAPLSPEPVSMETKK